VINDGDVVLPYFCIDHIPQVRAGQGIGDPQVFIQLTEGKVEYVDQHGSKYTPTFTAGNRYLPHIYSIGATDLGKLPNVLESQIHADLTDDEIFVELISQQDKERYWSAVYAKRTGLSENRAISKRVAEFRPIRIIDCEKLAIHALLVMERCGLRPELKDDDKPDYNIPQFLKILALCGTLPIFNTFVKTSGMLSKQLEYSAQLEVNSGFENILNYLLNYPEEKYDKVPKADVRLDAFKYVFEQANLSPADQVATFWKFLRICDFRPNFDQHKINIYNFFADQSMDFNNPEITSEYDGYTAARMQDKVDTYRYIASRAPPTQELTDEEIKNRSDLEWVKKAFSSYGDTVTVSPAYERGGILIINETDYQLVPYAYFRRKMSSLRYPEESLPDDDEEGEDADDTNEEEDDSDDTNEDDSDATNEDDSEYAFTPPGFLINTRILQKKRKRKEKKTSTYPAMIFRQPPETILKNPKSRGPR